MTSFAVCLVPLAAKRYAASGKKRSSITASSAGNVVRRDGDLFGDRRAIARLDAEVELAGLELRAQRLHGCELRVGRVGTGGVLAGGPVALQVRQSLPVEREAQQRNVLEAQA